MSTAKNPVVRVEWMLSCTLRFFPLWWGREGFQVLEVLDVEVDRDPKQLKGVDISWYASEQPSLLHPAPVEPETGTAHETW